MLGCAAFLLGPAAALFAAHLNAESFKDYEWPRAAEFARLRGLFWVNVRIALGSALIATLCGVTVALALHRARGWWKRFLACAFPVPLLIPPTIVTIAYTHLIGKRGIAMALWREWTGAAELPFSMYGEAGASAVLGLCWFPLVTMSTLVGLRAVGATAIQAGRIHAGPWTRVRHIDAPLLAPYVSAGSIFVAWLALGDFEVPPVLLLNTYTLQIYAAIKSFEMAKALVLSVPLLAVTALVLLARYALARGSAEATIDTYWRARPSAEAGARPGGRWLHAAALAILLLAVAAPVLSLVHQSTGWGMLRRALQTAGAQVFNTFGAALGAAAILTVAGAPYAWLLATTRGWRRAALALLACAPLAIPGTIHGLAWTEALQLTAWGRALLNCALVVSLADAARFFPLAVFLLAATFAAVHPSLPDAARLAGAGLPRRFKHIHLPLTYTGILSAFAIVYALSAGELAASILLNPVGFMTLPVRISSLLHFGQDELLAALCLIQIFLSLLPYLAASLLLERVLEVRLG